MAIRWDGKQLKQNDNTGLTDDSNSDLSSGLRQGYELGSLTDGLVAYYPFDGTVEDKALSRSVTDNTSAGFVSGKVGSEAKDFDGNDDYLNIAPEAFKTSKAFTLNLWVNKNGTSRQDFVAGDSGTPGPRMIRYWNNTDSWQFTFTDDSGSSYTIRGGSPNDNWTQLTGVYNGEKMLFYENGSLIGSKSVGSVSPTNIDNHYNIGRNPADVNYLNGQLDELRFYDRALSRPEIEALYNRTQTQGITDKDRLTSGLVGHWPLNEDNVSNAYDLSGRVNDASSVTGTSTAVGLGGAQARRFNGGDEFIEIGNAVLGISSDFSVNFWVNPDDVTPSDEMQLIMENGRDVTSTIKSGEVRFRVYDGSSNYQSHYSISNEEWTMLTATWDYSNNTLKFYKNAVNSPAGSNKANGNAGHTGFRIGDHPSSGYGSYKGSIADLRAYNRVLTKSEIEELANQGGL